MKILITGSNGFLGSNLVSYFMKKNRYEIYCTSRNPLKVRNSNTIYGDLREISFVKNLFEQIKPDVVINTVSLVDLDLCEENPSLAYDLTVKTGRNIAQCASEYNSRLAYISTDHLFDGNKSMYTEKEKTNPVNQYGKMKFEAENVSCKYNEDTIVIRTNFFGWSHINHPDTFGEWVYKSLKSKKAINLFTDYYFTPIEVTYLAEAIEKAIEKDITGVLNIVGSQRCSKYEFGMKLADLAGMDKSLINPCSLNDGIMTLKTKRQQDLSMSSEKYKALFGHSLPDLNENILRFLGNKDR
ncbi:dTDP-4-dehydrorhamnose reductase [Methanolobus vulcani]|jgi:dTDP-4-dehydrorhamnose reductase|uniref:dTDP-4-dehydrorhamnose reductase n=1 Tax=Methanolobus vulcani TaxID=38026 RepID=A0A7Z7AVR9_9EURY|nr:SDR family oxidoreductase [Methanolobus vulcani]SDF57542.1 dTDP-4-dehydrorhamnose reductase [Methanolobus vulcani]